MYIARLLYPVKVLGPGNRIAIWFSGCEHHCNGCCNPELWTQSNDQYISAEGIKTLINSVAFNNRIDGFSLTGGDPFFQPEALKELLPFLLTISEDILVYTGYDFNYVSEKYSDIINNIAVLIDGKYIEKQNYGSVLKGSDNQKIILLKEKYIDSYEQYLKEKQSHIQNFYTDNGIVSVGIHRADYKIQLENNILKRGLIKSE